MDLDVYLAEAFTLEAISRDIGDVKKTFVVADGCLSTSNQQEIAESKEGDVSRIMGFAQLTQGTTDPCLTSYPAEEMIELQRLYVSSATHGKGLGKALMSRMFERAREMGYRYIWLGVWEGNFVAQKVYERSGFERVGEHEFVMGRCVQIDWIMVKTL